METRVHEVVSLMKMKSRYHGSGSGPQIVSFVGSPSCVLKSRGADCEILSHADTSARLVDYSCLLSGRRPYRKMKVEKSVPRAWVGVTLF